MPEACAPPASALTYSAPSLDQVKRSETSSGACWKIRCWIGLDRGRRLTSHVVARGRGSTCGPGSVLAPATCPPPQPPHCETSRLAWTVPRYFGPRCRAPLPDAMPVLYHRPAYCTVQSVPVHRCFALWSRMRPDSFNDNNKPLTFLSVPGRNQIDDEPLRGYPLRSSQHAHRTGA